MLVNELINEEKKVYFIPEQIKKEIKQDIKVDQIFCKIQEGLTKLNNNLKLNYPNNYSHEEMTFSKNEKLDQLIINISFIENYNITGLNSYKEGEDIWSKFFSIYYNSTLIFKYECTSIYKLSTNEIIDINSKIIIQQIGFLNLKKNSILGFVIDKNINIEDLNFEFSFKKNLNINIFEKLSNNQILQMVNKFHIDNMIKSINKDLDIYGIFNIKQYEIVDSFLEKGKFQGLILKWNLLEKSILNNNFKQDIKYDNFILLKIVDFDLYQTYELNINFNHYTGTCIFSNRCKKDIESFDKEKKEFKEFLGKILKSLMINDKTYILENVDYSKFN